MNHKMISHSMRYLYLIFIYYASMNKSPSCLIRIITCNHLIPIFPYLFIFYIIIHSMNEEIYFLMSFYPLTCIVSYILVEISIFRMERVSCINFKDRFLSRYIFSLHFKFHSYLHMA